MYTKFEVFRESLAVQTGQLPLMVHAKHFFHGVPWTYVNYLLNFQISQGTWQGSLWSGNWPPGHSLFQGDVKLMMITNLSSILQNTDEAAFGSTAGKHKTNSYNKIDLEY